MSTLTFYRQARADGGLRTGIELDGATLLEDYLPGNQDYNPALLWYVDLRCEGGGLPADPETARQWILANSQPIQHGFAACADELQVGLDNLDHGLRPYARTIAQQPDGSVLRVFVTAIRRVDARTIAAELCRIGDDWKESLTGADTAGERLGIRRDKAGGIPCRKSSTISSSCLAGVRGGRRRRC